VEHSTDLGRFQRTTWTLLGLTVAVILWGAVVRLTGSGAGCGEHWPLCDGEIIPRAPSTEKLIEFTHRLTSGLALLGTVALFTWARRILPAGHRVRRAAGASLGFMLAEAAVGAMLVLLALVADNDSTLRALVMAVHLVNTFLLLGALTTTAMWSGGAPTLDLHARPRWTMAWLIGLGLMCLVGASGGIAALGDTLFPVSSLGEGLAQDFSPTAHLLIRLRIFHPILAVGGALYLGALAIAARHRLGWVLLGLVCLQVVGGFVNLALLAPAWMQLTHLALADAVWCTLVATGLTVSARQ
jgi:cytochrome c oxidase assembly protein subunit 15